MKTIADLWPLLVIAGLGFCVYGVIRMARRFSPGSVSAGPKTPPDSLIKGQTEAAEDLRTIEKRLDTRPESMIHRIESSCVELGVPAGGIAPGIAAEQHIDLLLRRLEAHLGLDFSQQDFSQHGFSQDRVFDQSVTGVQATNEGFPT